MKDVEFFDMLKSLSLTYNADDRELLIKAADACELFDWPVSAEKSAARLLMARPDLRLVSIEDDYLDARWMSAFESAVAPIKVQWRQAMLIDGRNGR